MKRSENIGENCYFFLRKKAVEGGEKVAKEIGIYCQNCFSIATWIKNQREHTFLASQNVNFNSYEMLPFGTVH